MKNIVAIVMVLMSFFVSVELEAMKEVDPLFTTPEKKPRVELFSISPQEKNRVEKEGDSIKKSARRLWEYESSESEEFEDDGEVDNYSDCRKSPMLYDEENDNSEEFCCSLCQGRIEIILECGHSYCANCAFLLIADGQECSACSDFTS